MQERHLRLPDASARRLVDQAQPLVSQPPQDGLDVVDLVRDVVQPRAPLGEELADRRVVVERGGAARRGSRPRPAAQRRDDDADSRNAAADRSHGRRRARAAQVETIPAHCCDRCRPRRARAPWHRPRRGRRQRWRRGPAAHHRRQDGDRGRRDAGAHRHGRGAARDASALEHRRRRRHRSVFDERVSPQRPGVQAAQGRRCIRRAADSRACGRRAPGLRLRHRGIRAVQPRPGAVLDGRLQRRQGLLDGSKRIQGDRREIKDLRHQVDKGCKR